MCNFEKRGCLSVLDEKRRRGIKPLRAEQSVLYVIRPCKNLGDRLDLCHRLHRRNVGKDRDYSDYVGGDAAGGCSSDRATAGRAEVGAGLVLQRFQLRGRSYMNETGIKGLFSLAIFVL